MRTRLATTHTARRCVQSPETGFVGKRYAAARHFS